MYTPVNIFHVNFLVFLNWFMSISISQLKDHYISVDQARYITYVVAKDLDTVIKKIKTTLPHDMIFTK